MTRIYVASSWRNERQPDIIAELRAAGHEVYDFRKPPFPRAPFKWSKIDERWQEWTLAEFKIALDHPLALGGFGSDRGGLDWCDVCLLVCPCGRSAHLELGFAIGQGKIGMILLADGDEPELMYRFAHPFIYTELAEVLKCLDGFGNVFEHRRARELQEATR